MGVIVSAAIGAGSLTACSQASSDTSGSGPKTYTVGIIEGAKADLIDRIDSKFQKAVAANLGDAKVKFVVKNANSNQSLITSISTDFATSGYDAYAGIGTPAILSLASQVKHKPVIAVAMGDPVGAGVAKNLDAPGGNVTGSTDFIDPSHVLSYIAKINPAIRTVGTVYDPSNQNMQIWLKRLNSAAKKSGLKVTAASISGPSAVQASASSLVGRADAIVIGPDTTVISGMAAISSTALGAKLPLYVSGSGADVKGVLASVGPDYDELGTLAGERMAKVLLGADPAKEAFALPNQAGLTINTATAEILGITVPDAVMSQATTVKK
ncbi:ABC transporter substrate-binding protein [Streptomyces sp. NPDC004629]|uniref:ABC transporter substrate-binding protein n=1 Tax=Streptomyces sp. NPDC004629 TaxID=3364705 RepID=UPI00368D0384